jgi:WD40 repeat protein
MKRWPASILIPAVGLLLAACNLTSPVEPTSAVPGVPPTVEKGTVVAATSSIPTSTPQTATGSRLPVGTLILTQRAKPIAQLPGPGRQTITVTEERLGGQASPDGRYGVRFDRKDTVTDLALVDFSADPSSPTKDIPPGKGLSGPGITWKDDSSGFAFFDFPPPDNAKASSGAILYYDVSSGQTKQLVPPPPEAGMIAASIAFSPDGKYLMYTVGSASGEGIGGPGGPGSKASLLDTTTGQSIQLPADTFGFNQWLRDSKGFITVRGDPSGLSQVYAYSLSDLAHPKLLTPANTSDFFVDLSPDGKRIVTTSTPAKQTNQPANIFIMNLDGSSRKQLTNFNAVDQTITALIWGNDGIYYSLSGADSTETTWRMDLDGSNATQVAQGTLISIVGVR